MKLLFTFLFVPLFSFSQTFTQNEIDRYKSQAQRVTIVRDNWGVPHIYGKSDADAVFGLLYAQCEENFFKVEENNLEMLGRLSEVYGENELDNGLKVFARCIGHGGMPVAIEEEPSQQHSSCNLVAFDQRERKKIDKFPVGYNGYAVLKLKGPELVVEYYDDNDNNDLNQERKILEEKWQWQNGKLQGVSATDFTTGWPQKLTQVQAVEKAIQTTRPQPTPAMV